MKITSINLARMLVFFPGGTEIAIGRIPIDAATALLSERYRFHVYPRTFEEWHKPDGVPFVYGQHNGIIITRMVLYARGIGVDTQTSTDDCQRIIDDVLTSASETLGISLSEPITRKLYQSDVTFVSDVSLNAIHPAVAALAAKAEPFAELFMPPAKYEVSRIQLNVDEAIVKYAASPFRVERREGSPFSENVYFSSAPMPTSAHAAALEEFEAALVKEQNGRKVLGTTFK